MLLLMVVLLLLLLSLHRPIQSVAVCLEAPAVQESGKGVPAAGDDQGLKARLAPLVQLAEDTGAVLVPVVALGEETASRSLVEALLMPAERIPTKVGASGVLGISGGNTS
jgi:hypothetical protein